MFNLSQLQHEFMHHLLDKDSAIAENVTQQGSVPVSTRLGVYGNAYKVRLKSSIENDHEMLGIYLGDDLFDLMAAGYIASKPSHYTSLQDFCEHLPEYLRNTQPFSDTPIIAEIAEFERNLLFAFDAGNAKRAAIEDLASLPPQQEELSAQWLIWRNHDRITEFRSLAIDEYVMLNGFLHGANFADICELLLEHHKEEEVATSTITHLTSWLTIGIISIFQ